MSLSCLIGGLGSEQVFLHTFNPFMNVVENLVRFYFIDNPVDFWCLSYLIEGAWCPH